MIRHTIESIGRVGSRVRLGVHEMTFDQPSSVAGGEDRGPSPLEAMIVAVAACAHYFAAAYLHGRGLPTDGLTIEVEAEKEIKPVSRIGRLSLKVKVPLALDARQVAAVERAIKSCPAYGTLLHPPTVAVTVAPSRPTGETAASPL